jgi:Pyridoxamine 5'-phosphate oxidase
VDAKDVALVMHDPIAQELLHSPLLAHLAYCGADGFPRVVPIGGIWNGAEYVVCTATTAPKVGALMKDPKVAFTINTEADVQPPHILLVRGVARLEIVDGIPTEYLEASRKAVPQEQWETFETQVRNLYPHMARIAILPLWAKVLDFQTRLPEAVEHLIRGQV